MNEFDTGRRRRIASGNGSKKTRSLPFDWPIGFLTMATDRIAHAHSHSTDFGSNRFCDANAGSFQNHFLDGLIDMIVSKQD